MSRKCKSWGRTAAEEEWLSQELLYINTSWGLVKANTAHRSDVKKTAPGSRWQDSLLMGAQTRGRRGFARVAEV